MIFIGMEKGEMHKSGFYVFREPVNSKEDKLLAVLFPVARSS